MRRLSERAVGGVVDAAGSAWAWGNVPGFPGVQGVARTEGLCVDGGFVVAWPMQCDDRHIEGEGPSASVRLVGESPSGGPWNSVAYSKGGQRQHLSGLRVSANGLARDGLSLAKFSRSALHSLEVSGALERGVYLEHCQTTMLVHSLYAHHCRDGIVVQGCNALQGAAWRVTDCDRDGLTVLGDYAPGSEPPWPWNGDVGLMGINVERCGRDGIVVRDHLLPVSFAGQLRVEAVAGRGLVVDNAAVTVQTARITSGGVCVHVRNGGRLTVLGDLYVDCHTSGQEPTVLVEDAAGHGGGLRVNGRIYTYNGQAVRMVRR